MSVNIRFTEILKFGFPRKWISHFLKSRFTTSRLKAFFMFVPFKHFLFILLWSKIRWNLLQFSRRRELFSKRSILDVWNTHSRQKSITLNLQESKKLIKNANKLFCKHIPTVLAGSPARSLRKRKNQLIWIKYFPISKHSELFNWIFRGTQKEETDKINIGSFRRLQWWGSGRKLPIDFGNSRA